MRSIQPDVFVVGDDGHATLIGGHCASSGHVHFPLQDCCPYTGATDVARVELPSTGTVWGWTAVTNAPPGYDGPVPYGFGVVELDGVGLRVVTRLEESDPSQLAFGDHVELVAAVVATDADGTEIATWSFKQVTP